MCLITLAYRSHPDYPLLLAANRDEFYQRPTATLDFWDDAPELLAGRDLEAGGTWMGITRSGRFAAITNHRNPPSTPQNPRSRGMLTVDFLLGDQAAEQYLQAVARRAGEYAGFNLLLGDADGLYYFSNIESQVRTLPAGIYSVSNGLLDSAWPKQRIAEQGLTTLLQAPLQHEQLKATVSDRSKADDTQLPQTGVGLELERTLSSQFIVADGYGTRATTSLWVHRSGEVELSESTFVEHGQAAGCRQLGFSLSGRE
ncbi:MAG: NRDE family protein [Halieaceae bacterium]